MALFGRKKKEIPFGLWMKCPSCGQMQFTKTVEENLNVCPACGFHMKVNAPTRAKQILDAGSFEEFGQDLEPRDILRFQDESGSYEEKLARTKAKAGVSEAVLAGRGTIDGHPVSVAIMDFSFRGGSMGVVVGERIAQAAEDAYERTVPLIVVATSGGARMQEGALSLMQMAKTSAAIARLRDQRIPYFVVLADPCTGGVSASFAAQGDVTLAEPGALIGFAGPRVIQQTIKTELPDGFQRSEFLLDKGYVDRIVPRDALKAELATLISFLGAATRRTPEPMAADASE